MPESGKPEIKRDAIKKERRNKKEKRNKKSLFDCPLEKISLWTAKQAFYRYRKYRWISCSIKLFRENLLSSLFQYT